MLQSQVSSTQYIQKKFKIKFMLQPQVSSTWYIKEKLNLECMAWFSYTKVHSSNVTFSKV